MEIDGDVRPQIEESGAEDDRSPKDRLLGLLDRVEALVERLRKETLLLEERKDSLFTTLDYVKNHELLSELGETDKDDIKRYIDRVIARCMTVEILVRTERDKAQEEALYQVNHLIDALVVNFHQDPPGTRLKCQSYIAACSSQPEHPADKGFETALLGCTLDDQKKIKKRLQGLLNYLEQDGKIIPMPED